MISDFSKFILIVFYGCLNVKDTKNKSLVTFDLCSIAKDEDNPPYPKWVYCDEEMQLRSGDEMFFRLSVTNPSLYTSTINRGYFKVV